MYKINDLNDLKLEYNHFYKIFKPRIAHHLHWDNRYYKILADDMTWHSITFKPLSIAFGLKDKNGDGVLTINGQEHVSK